MLNNSYQTELKQIQQQLDQHLDRVTQLQNQLERERQHIFSCFKQEKQILAKLQYATND